MKFINILKNKVENKIQDFVKDIVQEVFIKYDVQLEDQREYIEALDVQLSKINRDIVYIAEALKHTHILLQKLEEEENILTDNDDSSDKTFH
tara:strand:+ start:3533 stop:3808 length:276 start_codon:yes stop_codon:yes gene_type:complete